MNMWTRSGYLKSIVLVILILIQSLLLFADELDIGHRAVRTELEHFYDGIYNARERQIILSSRENLYRALAAAEISSYAQSFINAKADMILGKHYILEDYAWYDPSFGEPYLRQARSGIEEILKYRQSAEAYALASEIRGSLFLLSPARYIFSHGTAARSLSRKAREADPENVNVLILLANEALYTPRFYGGNPGKAMDYFLHAMENYLEAIAGGAYADPVVLFTLYSGTGLAIRDLGDDTLAKKWLSRSLEIYPDNPYIRTELTK